MTPKETILEKMKDLSPEDQDKVFAFVLTLVGKSEPIWDRLAALGKQLEGLPSDDLPPDLAANHDHYLHGLPRRT